MQKTPKKKTLRVQIYSHQIQQRNAFSFKIVKLSTQFTVGRCYQHMVCLIKHYNIVPSVECTAHDSVPSVESGLNPFQDQRTRIETRLH
ncbi:hypothetical protein EUGRSUZ_G01084 [Eucalyptus grandis]|uniref:Uncharacterized protein n=2 Tax=Eucalyptus grandis TaxID=71139 RepID=A0ACC3K1L2_EUCGR|nr:hypothetical protein EUGRSUZ_G01084 [Eucalyptus grandis]